MEHQIKVVPDPLPGCSILRRAAAVAQALVIPLVIQTIRRVPSRSDAIDGAPNLSRADPSVADQIDAEHQPTDLAVGASNPWRRGLADRPLESATQ
jgi:hypothetical protein